MKNTRRVFLQTVGAGLLATTSVWAAPDKHRSTSRRTSNAADVVNQFLAFRDSHAWAKAYALLSSSSQKMLTFDQFIQTKQFPKDPAADGMTPILAAVSVLFIDRGDTLGYRFQVASLASNDPRTVLVDAIPPHTGQKNGDKPFLLHVVTAPDPHAGGMLRIEMMPTYEQTDPVGFVAAKEKAPQIISLSNLRQIGLAIIVYLQAHDSQMPSGDTWVDDILPYLLNRTPPAEKERQTASLFRDPAAPAAQTWCYAFNRNLSKIKLADILNSSQTVLVFESTAGTKNAADTGKSLPTPGWHSHGKDCVLADGHALWLPDTATLSFDPSR